MYVGYRFFYMDRWSSRVTWAGEPPQLEGESVVIPAEKAVLYNVSDAPNLKVILIEGSMVFEDTQVCFCRKHIIMHHTCQREI